MNNIRCYYRPRSEVSEGYVFIGLCHSLGSTRGEIDNTKGQPPSQPGSEVNHIPPWPWSDVNTPPPGQGQRSTTSPTSLARVIGQPPPPPTSGHYAQAGDTHPTGMHSCFEMCSRIRDVNLKEKLRELVPTYISHLTFPSAGCKKIRTS